VAEPRGGVRTIQKKFIDRGDKESRTGILEKLKRWD
jgi:hypothetical protein